MRIALGLVVVLAFAGHAARYYKIPFVDHFENIVYDATPAPDMANSSIREFVIIDIDEKSLAAEGRWPWRRDKLAPCLTSFSITTRPESSVRRPYSPNGRKFRTGHPAGAGTEGVEGHGVPGVSEGSRASARIRSRLC